MKNVYCDIDNWAIGLDQLIGDIPAEVANEMAIVVPEAAKRTTKLVKKNARGYGWKGKTGKAYVSGFSNKVTRMGVVTSAEVGNRRFPGLVHLLEKGHNTMAGRRIAGKPHLEPAWNDTKDKFFRDAIKGVDKVLKG